MSDFRLPTNVWPNHYDLTIHTDLKNFRYSGFVKISLDVKTATNSVIFNSAALTLSNAVLTSSSLAEPYAIPRHAFNIDVLNERVTIPLPFTFDSGSKITLSIGFNAPLTDRLKGYYRSSWNNEGRTEYYAVTQFQPTDARFAFPCWDEPLFKATFSITLISHVDTVNLSNMSILFEKIYDDLATSENSEWFGERDSLLPSSDGEWKITSFKTTPPMSTYIVAFANGPFSFLEGSYESPLSHKSRPLRVYATANLVQQGKFALQVTQKVLPIYEQIFGIEYPLPKLDTLVASDFAAGAMENWGLIIGRDQSTLLDSDRINVAVRKRIARGQSHEVAHMWFGNITTMAWWDSLYLNEGFASLVGEVIMMDRIFPEFQANAEFIVGKLNGALKLDAKRSSHPVEVKVPSASMINQLFDQLSYYKAASLLRMLSQHIGEAMFLAGVSNYLKTHLYGCTVTENLWEGIGSVAGVDVSSIMDVWVKQTGFPVLTVIDDRDGIHIKQDRFLESGPASEHENQTLWTVPLNLMFVGPNGDKQIDHAITLNSRERFISLDTSKPFKLNAGTVGFFRVNYSPSRLAMIADEISRGSSLVFSLEDRIGIITDTLALVKAGYTPISSLLNLIHVCRGETEYLVWLSVGQVLSDITSVWWENETVLTFLSGLRKSLFMPLVAKLGYDYREDEEFNIRELRTLAVTQTAEAGQPEVIHELYKRFRQFLETGDDSRIPDELRQAVYQVVARNGGQMEWDRLAAIVANPPSPNDGMAAIYGLTSFRNDLLIEQTFSFIEEKCRDQDLLHFFNGLKDNLKYRRFLALKFREDYEMYMKRIEGTFVLQYVVSHSHDSLSTFGDLQEARNFFAGKDISNYKITLDQVFEAIHIRANWIERSTEDLLGWLETNLPQV